MMIRLSLLVVVVAASAIFGTLVHAKPPEKVDKPAPTITELADPNDLLRLIKATDKQVIDSPHYRSVVKRLEKSKVPTTRKAEQEALAYKLKHGGLLAEEGAKVVSLLRIAFDVPDFASGGDLVWVVRISHLDRGVTQEMWISSTTGTVRTMLPMGKPK